MSQEKPVATTRIVCGVVICKDDKFLLVQEKQPKAYGKWNMPSGRVDEGETLEQAAVREAKEETGFDVKLGDKLNIVHDAVEKPVKHAYAAEIIGGELNYPDDEIMDAKWFTYEEVTQIKDRLRNVDFVLGSIEKFRSIN